MKEKIKSGKLAELALKEIIEKLENPKEY